MRFSALFLVPIVVLSEKTSARSPQRLLQKQEWQIYWANHPSHLSLIYGVGLKRRQYLNQGRGESSTIVLYEVKSECYSISISQDKISKLWPDFFHDPYVCCLSIC